MYQKIKKGKKKELRSILHTIYKLNSKYIIDRNVKPKTIKILHENTDKHIVTYSKKFLSYNLESTDHKTTD